MLLALFNGPITTWSFVDILILIVIVAACVALMFIALKQFGITIPPWAVQCFWIVVIAFVVIFCIKLVASM